MPETQDLHVTLAAETASPLASAGPWEFEHQLHYFTQVQTRAGQPDQNGSRWAEHQPTGKVNVMCNCGLATGWVDRDQAPTYQDLRSLHPSPSHQTAQPDTIR